MAIVDGAATPSGSPRLSRERIADQIVAELLARIGAGVYPRGSKLPTERELAAAFGVSSPTVRESLRALTSMGLVEVRHGSGAYVKSSSQGLLDTALGLVVQLEDVRVDDLLGLLRVLNFYVAESAIGNATDDDIARMRAAAEITAAAQSPDQLVAAIEEFLLAYVGTARSPLLNALCRFLVSVLTAIERTALGDKEPRFWLGWGADTAPLRLALVDAIAARDQARLVNAVRDLHEKIAERIRDVPDMMQARISDPVYRAVLSNHRRA